MLFSNPFIVSGFARSERRGILPRESIAEGSIAGSKSLAQR